MNPELEERILFVLSALEDANDALDKCDKLILAKKSTTHQAQSTTNGHSSNQLNGTSHHPPLPPPTSSKDQVQHHRRQYNNVKGDTNSQGKPLSSCSKPTVKEPVSLKGSTPAAAKGKKTKAVQTDFPFKTTSSTSSSKQHAREKQKPQSHTNCKCSQNEACASGRKSQKKLEDIDVAKLVKTIKGNNEEQWKHVRKFIRQVLLAELEEEKWTRRSTEELNTRLSKQNQYLRAKLQEKRDERLKLDEQMKEMKNKFQAKSKVQDENQQLVLSKCEETFEKLNKLHQDLDGIQKKLVEELDQPSSGIPGSPRSVEEENIIVAAQVLEESEGPAAQEWSEIQRELMRERILHEYYPMMAESRFIMEKLLSSIGIRISRLIQLNLKTHLPDTTDLVRMASPRTNGNGVCEDETTDDEEDLVQLFSKELSKTHGSDSRKGRERYSYHIQ